MWNKWVACRKVTESWRIIFNDETSLYFKLVHKTLEFKGEKCISKNLSKDKLSLWLCSWTGGKLKNLKFQISKKVTSEILSMASSVFRLSSMQTKPGDEQRCYWKFEWSVHKWFEKDDISWRKLDFFFKKCAMTSEIIIKHSFKHAGLLANTHYRWIW